MNEPETTRIGPPRPPPQARYRPWFVLSTRGLAFSIALWGIVVIVYSLCRIGAEPAEHLQGMAIVGAVMGAVVLTILYGVGRLFARLTPRQRIMLSAACVVLILGASGVMFARSQLTNAARLTPAQEVTLVMRQHIRIAKDEFNAARNRLGHYPLLSPFWIEAPEDVDQARDAVEALRAANDELKFASSYPADRVRAECLARDIIDEAEVRSLVTEGQGHPNYLSIQRLGELENQRADALLRMCDFYQSRWDQWEYRQDAEQMMFDNSSAEAEWNAIASEIERIQAEQYLVLGQINPSASNAAPEVDD